MFLRVHAHVFVVCVHVFERVSVSVCVYVCRVDGLVHASARAYI